MRAAPIQTAFTTETGVIEMMSSIQAPQNRPARNARRGLIIALLGLVMMVYPPVSRMDGMNGGYALQTLGLFVIIVGIVTWAAYRVLAIRFGRILSGEGLLAHWTYSPDEWRAYTEEEFATRSGDMKGLLFSTLAIAAIVCGGFALTHDDAVVIMLGLWIGLTIILSITAFIASHQGLGRNRSAPGEAIISRLGVLLPAEEHFWGVLGTRITSATEQGDPATLTVEYVAPNRYGYEEYVVRVRVPQGQEQSAQQVAAALNMDAVGLSAPPLEMAGDMKTL
jgi:hypothetical protein